MIQTYGKFKFNECEGPIVLVLNQNKLKFKRMKLKKIFVITSVFR